mgnify:CR=1 FL=1
MNYEELKTCVCKNDSKLYRKFTVEILKQEATRLNLTFKSKDKKDDLINLLLENHNKNEEVDSEEESEVNEESEESEVEEESSTEEEDERVDLESSDDESNIEEIENKKPFIQTRYSLRERKPKEDSIKNEEDSTSVEVEEDEINIEEE